MMLPTHIAIGLTLITPLIYIFPDEVAFPLSLGVIIGSSLPDLDLLYGIHRKTFHAPIYSWLVVGFTAIPFMIVQTPITAALFAVSFGFSQHSISDVFGGGLEHKPWRKTSNKAVYNHHSEHWWSPKHYASYDGSPRDLAIFGSLAFASHFTYNQLPYFTYFIGGLGIIAITYTVSRKILPDLDTYIYKRIPQVRPLLRIFGDENRRENH